MPKPIYAMWSDIEKKTSPEAVKRIKDFYEAIRYTGPVSLFNQFSWKDAIKTLAYYEQTHRVLVSRDQDIVDSYKAFYGEM